MKARKHICVTDRHDMTLAVKVALNPNTTNQIQREIIPQPEDRTSKLRLAKLQYDYDKCMCEVLMQVEQNSYCSLQSVGGACDTKQEICEFLLTEYIPSVSRCRVQK